ncbi:MAG: protein kinase [Magnetococcus sp. DMHC-6]
MLELPRTIGKYRLLSQLGQGTMGTVYRALDPRIDRVVAIKVIHQHLLWGEHGTAVISRFEQEARAAGRLMHPGIVLIFEYGQENGSPFIAMEYVEGADLKTLQQNHRPFPIDWGFELIGQLLDALSYAHTQGVVHRDIKPANLVLHNTGRLKVMDFGIARLETSHMTQTGLMMGSPGFMAPEQVQGERVDPRSDLFSVGVILYELLTMVKPFIQDSIAATCQRILTYSPPPPSVYNAMLPVGMDDVVLKAMAKDREQRFSSALEFKQAMLGCFGGSLRVQSTLPDLTMDLGAFIKSSQPSIPTSTRAEKETPTLEEPRTFSKSMQTAYPIGSESIIKEMEFMAIPLEELPTNLTGVDIYLLFDRQFVLFQSRAFTLEGSVRTHWQESGIQRIFIPKEQFGDYLAVFFAVEEENGIDLRLHYIQKRLYPINRNLLIAESSPAFSLYAFHANQFIPVVIPDSPGLGQIPPQEKLAKFSKLYIHLQDLESFFNYLNRHLGATAVRIPLNRRGAALAREKARMAAYALFNSPKVREALCVVKETVVDLLELVIANPDTYYAMLAVSDLDSNTYIHSTNVMVLSLGLGHAMGYNRGQLTDLGLGAFLHDIGKRDINPKLLLKREAVTDRQYETLKEHVLLGTAFCQLRPEIPDSVTRIVSQHHERLDGSGYPMGLTKFELEEMGQIVAIMEIYDAMTSHQPYRKAFTPFQAMTQIRQMKNGLNQKMVSLFIRQLGMQIMS